MAARLDGEPGEVVPLFMNGQSRVMRNMGLILSVGCAIWLLTDDDGRNLTVPIIGLVVGALVAAWGLVRLAHPGKPAYVLLPQGLFIHIAKVRDILVPWSEVKDVFTQDVKVTMSGVPMHRYGKFKGVTSLRISQDFYDREIHVDSMYQRGPGWSNVFVSSPEGLSIALQHEALGVDPTLLRRAIEARWRAFGSPPAN